MKEYDVLCCPKCGKTWDGIKCHNCGYSATNTMKRFAFILMAIATVTFTGCSKDDGAGSSNLADKLSVGLRTYLVNNYDSNDNGKLENSEIENITYLQIYDVDIESYDGIEYLKNLEEIAFTKVNSPCNLDLSKNAKLQRISISDTDLTGISFEGDNLTRISIFRTAISSIDASKCPNLTSLRIAQNQNLKVIDAHALVNLERLDLSECPIEEVDISGCTALWDFMIGLHFDISTQGSQHHKTYGGFVSGGSEILNISSSYLKKINLSGLNIEELRILRCTDYGFGQTITYLQGELTSLKVDNCTNLKMLFCSDNKLTTLDVSSCNALETLNCYRNNISEIWLKEGQNITNLNKDTSTEIKYK